MTKIKFFLTKNTGKEFPVAFCVLHIFLLGLSILYWNKEFQAIGNVFTSMFTLSVVTLTFLSGYGIIYNNPIKFIFKQIPMGTFVLMSIAHFAFKDHPTYPYDVEHYAGGIEGAIGCIHGMTALILIHLYRTDGRLPFLEKNTPVLFKSIMTLYNHVISTIRKREAFGLLVTEMAIICVDMFLSSVHTSIGAEIIKLVWTVSQYDMPSIPFVELAINLSI